MAADSLNAFLRVLHDSQLLEAEQLEELQQRLQPSFTEPRELAKELVQRGWLTRYQLKQLARGQARNLVLGSYILLEPLGEGGMGQVFKARHQKMGRIVALKVIRKDQLANAGTVRRFQREIQAVAQLSHPNVVVAYDAAQAGDTHFFAMEYVEGTDLNKLVKKYGPLSIGQACDYVRQAALGLHHAHERGLIHRDIKPSNLLLTHPTPTDPGGVIKILDLGLARWHSEEAEGETAQLTQSGVVMGTPDFIAPEQVEDSHTVDIRADVYSLGCTLYFLLTGTVPFPGGRFLDKLFKHKFEDPRPVEQLRPEVPAELAAVVHKLMAKQPENRFQTPAELATALAAIRSGPSAPRPFVKRPSPSGGSPAESQIPTCSEVVVTPPALMKAVPPPLSRPKGNAARPSRKGADKQRWQLHLGMGGVLAVGLVFLGFWLLRPGSAPGEKKPGVEPGPVADAVTLALNDLRAKLGRTDPNELLQQVLSFRLRHPGLPQAAEAATLLARLPSALDELDPAKIPPEDRAGGELKELVAVLGEQRLRHWGSVQCVAFSPSGLLASGGVDGVVRLWDPATGKELGVLRPSTGAVRALAFTRDGKILATGTTNTVKVWDVAARKELASLAGHKGVVRALAFSPDGKQLASGGEDRTARLWELATRKELAQLPGHTVPVAAVAFAPGGKMLATASQELTLWDVASRQKRASWKHGSAVQALAFTRDGNTLATGSNDKTVKLWDLTQSTERATAKLEGAVTSLAFAPAGQLLYAVANGHAVVLNPLMGREPTSITRSAAAVDVGPDGKTLAVAGSEGFVHVWNRPPLKERFAWRGHVGPVRWVAFAPDGKALFSGGLDRTMKVWTSATGQERTTVSRPAVHAAAIAPDGQTVALGTTTVQLWDVATEKLRVTFEAPAGAVQGLAFSPDGQTVAAAHADKILRLWDVVAGKVRFELPGPVAANTPVAFSPDGQLVAAVGEEKTVHLWYTATGLLWDSVGGHTAPVTALAFAGGGNTLATGGQDATVRLWDLGGTQVRERSLLKTPGSVLAVAFSLAGQELAAATGSGRLLLWQALSGQEIQAWQLPGAVHGVAFAPDGRHLATANANGTLYLLRRAAAVMKIGPESP